MSSTCLPIVHVHIRIAKANPPEPKQHSPTDRNSTTHDHAIPNPSHIHIHIHIHTDATHKPSTLNVEESTTQLSGIRPTSHPIPQLARRTSSLLYQRREVETHESQPFHPSSTHERHSMNETRCSPPQNIHAAAATGQPSAPPGLQSHFPIPLITHPHPVPCPRRQQSANASHTHPMHPQTAPTRPRNMCSARHALNPHAYAASIPRPSV